MSAPFVVVARGVVGDVENALVSVQTSASGGTTNVTPLTHAISATIASSGNPFDLAANIAAEKVNITPARVDAAEAGFRAALGDVLTAAGASGNLITTKFAADGVSGLDKLLELVQVTVQPSGEIQLQTSAAVQADDLGSNAPAPAAPVALVLANGVLPSASDKASLPPPSAGAVVTSADLENLRKAIQDCFATGSRGTFAGSNLSTACNAVPVDSAYKHQGRDRAQDFDGLLADSNMTGAKFLAPEILRPLTSTKVVVQFPFHRADGRTLKRVTVAQKLGAVWTLVGNKRDFDVSVAAFVSRRIVLIAGQTARLETGINFGVRNSFRRPRRLLIALAPADHQAKRRHRDSVREPERGAADFHGQSLCDGRAAEKYPAQLRIQMGHHAGP